MNSVLFKIFLLTKIFRYRQITNTTTGGGTDGADSFLL